MSGPFEGIKILDLTSMISGPLATLILADQGAHVIKIENPNGGDHTRRVSTRRNGFSASFLNNNRNKRSVAIDLKTQDGIALLKRLAEDCDVFVQNFRPGVIDRMGLSESVIRSIVPNIIYVSISGFGATGPYAKKPVYDPLVQALSGLATIQAGSDEARPRLVRTILPDKLTGFAAAQAISAALFARERRGVGQHIELSMLDSVMAFLWGSDMGAHTFVGEDYPTEKAQSFIDLIYETADGHISVAVQSDKEWQGLCAALERPEWLEDPRFASTALRQRNIDERLSLTQDVLKNRTAEDWLDRLEAEDVPCAPVLRRREAIRHPQMVANGLIDEFDHPTAGRIRYAKPAPKFSGTQPDNHVPAPGLGDDTLAVLTELGLSSAEIDDLAVRRIIHLGDNP